VDVWCGIWAWALDVPWLACPFQVGCGQRRLGRKLLASLDLKWQERREAGFTEQRSLSASNGGRITGRCIMGPASGPDSYYNSSRFGGWLRGRRGIALCTGLPVYRCGLPERGVALNRRDCPPRPMVTSLERAGLVSSRRMVPSLTGLRYLAAQAEPLEEGGRGINRLLTDLGGSSTCVCGRWSERVGRHGDAQDGCTLTVLCLWP